MLAGDNMKTQIIAHRGLSGIETENTAAAFVAAGNRTFFGIETDLHKTADGEYIIIHDDNTGRVASTNISVENSNFEELRKIRLFDKDGKTREDLCLPSFEEYLKICKRYGKIAVLELKNPFPENDIKQIFKIADREYGIENIIFISFVFENLVILRKLSKMANIQYLCDTEINQKFIDTLKANNFDIDTYYPRLNIDSVLLLKKNGIKINCWTVDNKETARKLADLGVDYITTNILEFI